ncbi:tetratricopeptide repeat protein [Maricaulis sp. CAU 1757]
MRFSRLAASLASLFLVSAGAAPAALAQIDSGACLAGREAMDGGETGAAILAFETCLGSADLTAEEEVGVYAALGAAFLAEERFEEALSAYNFAFAIVETQQAEVVQPALYRNRGIARLETGQTELGLRDLERAAAEMPNDVVTFLSLGIAYQDLDRSSEAVVAFDRVVQLAPDWDGAWINRSSALLDAGMTGAAVADARRAVELDPTSGSSLNMLCWTLIKDNRPETALPLCEQAVAAEPEIGAIVHSQAAALEALGRVEEALALYERAFELSPDDPEIAADYERTHNP